MSKISKRVKALRVASVSTDFCNVAGEPASLIVPEEDEEFPNGEEEIFSLPPLSVRRITARIRSVEPAPFVFVDEEDVPCEDL